MNSIILIGYMGAGKTTIGKLLSERLGYPFADTDICIEETQGRSVSDIFSESGEQVFRELETECLRKLAKRDGSLVLSTGGGLPLREENRRLLKKLGLVIFLNNKPETVYERLKGDTTRPLLKSGNPLEHIRSMMAARHDSYVAASDITIDTDDMSPEDILARIEEAMHEHSGN